MAPPAAGKQHRVLRISTIKVKRFFNRRNWFSWLHGLSTIPACYSSPGLESLTTPKAEKVRWGETSPTRCLLARQPRSSRILEERGCRANRHLVGEVSPQRTFSALGVV